MAAVFWLVVALPTGIWAGYDSSQLRKRRGGRPLDGIANTAPAAWAVVCVFLWLIGFVAYLATRPTLVREAQLGPFGGRYLPPGTPWVPVPQQVWGVAPVNAAPPVPQVAPPQLSPDGHWWWNGVAWELARR